MGKTVTLVLRTRRHGLWHLVLQYAARNIRERLLLQDAGESV